MRRLHTRLLATGGHTCLSLMCARFPRLLCRPWMQRLPLPDSCPAFLRQLIEDCWAEDPAARPGFPAIRQRLQLELDEYKSAYLTWQVGGWVLGTLASLCAGAALHLELMSCVHIKLF